MSRWSVMTTNSNQSPPLPATLPKYESDALPPSASADEFPPLRNMLPATALYSLRITLAQNAYPDKLRTKQTAKKYLKENIFTALSELITFYKVLFYIRRKSG